MTYDIGDKARLDAAFTNEASGALSDPTVVLLTVKPPNAEATVYTYGVGGTIVKDSTGNYHAEITVTAWGKWRYRWQGTGALVAAEEGAIFVRPSSV